MSNSDKVIVSLHKVGGLLSMIASSAIMRDIYKRRLEKKSVSLTSYIVLELSIGDFFSSLFSFVLGSWMAPKDSGAYLAEGNTATCTAQGFLDVLFSGMSVVCNAALAVVYCLVVKRGWNNSVQQRSAKIFLAVPPVYALISAAVPFYDQAYNYDYGECYIAAYPPGCLSNPEVECTRGSHSGVFSAVAVGFIFCVNMAIIASVLILIHSVLAQERKMDAYVISRGEPVSRTNTSKTTWQGIYYIAAYAITWVPWYSTVITSLVLGEEPLVLTYLEACTLSTQGVWNALVYFRPRYQSKRVNFTSSLQSFVRRSTKPGQPDNIAMPTANRTPMALNQQDSVEENILDQSNNQSNCAVQKIEEEPSLTTVTSQKHVEEGENGNNEEDI